MKKDGESWAEIAVRCAYEKGYRVLPNGKVKSHLGNILNCWIGTKGYFVFSTKKDGKSMKTMVHQLAAYQKYGEKIFNDDLQVRHLDNDKLNNKPNNIAIGTQSQNRMDMPKAERVKLARDAGRAQSPLTEQDVLDIRERFANGATLRDITDEYGIAKSTASYIKNRKTYKYL